MFIKKHVSVKYIPTYNDFMCYTNKYLKKIGIGTSEYR